MTELLTHEFPPDLWTFTHPLQLAGMNLGTRSSVWRLPSGGLAVHSPGRFTDEQYAAIDALGKVEILIAPNMMHYLFLERAARHWTDAKLLGAKGLSEKKPELPLDEVLADTGSFGDNVHWIRIEGMPKLNEYAFWHKPSKTLIVTDLCFHFVDHPQMLLRSFMRINAAYGDLKISRLFRSQIKNKAEFKKSIDKILEWDFDAITLAHGTPVQTGARQRFEKAVAFLRA